MIVVLAILGIKNINDINYIENESSSYTKTTFDYFISSPNEEQMKKINKLDSVNKTFPCYALNNAFTQNNKTKEIFIIMNDDLTNYDISLFNNKTLIKGNFDENGIMLDLKASELLGVNVGDEIKFSILGNTFKKKLSGIYLTSTYGTLTSGLALMKFSDDIKKIYSPKAYGFSFIESKDDVALENDLKDYVGEGNVALSYDEYVNIYCGTKAPYQTDEEYLTYCQNKYNEYREDTLAKAKRSAGQVVSKEDSYILIKDKLNSTKKNVNNLNIITAISAFALFTLVNIIFILTKKSDDKTEMLEGLSSNKLFIRHSLKMAITGISVFLISFIILLIKALNTYFISTIMPMILIFTLPVLGSVLILLLFDFIYLKILYKNNSK